MSDTALQFGSSIATKVRLPSRTIAQSQQAPRTLGDLLDILGRNPSKNLNMLRTTSVRLSEYMEGSPEQISLDSIWEAKDGFKAFLVNTRKHKLAAARSYVNYARVLLKQAAKFGWKPSAHVPEAWFDVVCLAKRRKCSRIVKDMIRLRATPREITVADVDDWVARANTICYPHATELRTLFWRLLRECDCTDQRPKCFLREKHYGIPLEQLPHGLRTEALTVLKWKQAVFAPGRPKNGKIRAVTAKKLSDLICRLAGYAINIAGRTDIASLAELVQPELIGDFVNWSINERSVKGEGLVRDLKSLRGAMRHPLYKSLDLSWYKELLDSIPTDDDDLERRARKNRGFLEYQKVQAIPDLIRSRRAKLTGKTMGRKEARLAMFELMIELLITLAWRQKNLRECRIGGPKPNLFKSKIDPFGEVDKPEWVLVEEQENPEAEFWQFQFSKDETKMKHPVHSVLPRRLVAPLEEYLNAFRPVLLRGSDPGTLLLNTLGRPMSCISMTSTVSALVAKYSGTRVTPHLFRNIVAFTWLKAHPKDYLTLSKILWHKDLNNTIRIYGERFNESSGVCAMETWLTERDQTRSNGSF